MHYRVDPTVELLRKKQFILDRKRIQKDKNTNASPIGTPNWCLNETALRKLNRSTVDIPVYDHDSNGDIDEDFQDKDDNGEDSHNSGDNNNVEDSDDDDSSSNESNDNDDSRAESSHKRKKISKNKSHKKRSKQKKKMMKKYKSKKSKRNNCSFFS